MRAGPGLQVPGLAENRPSVLKGDALFAKPADGSSGGTEFKGYVHVVRREEVLLRFAASFHDRVWIAGRRQGTERAPAASHAGIPPRMHACMYVPHAPVSLSGVWPGTPS